MKTSEDGLYFGNEKIDMVYNRLTDFSLQQYPVLAKAYAGGRVVLTPHPQAYAKYADKRNLARLTDASGLRALGVDEADVDALQAGVPHTFIVSPEWKLHSGQRVGTCSSNLAAAMAAGAYCGEKLTKRVFADILQGGYVAQKLAPPGERAVYVNEAVVLLKYDVRCFVYAGQIQLVVARLYQGQTTNFRTPGGGFAAGACWGNDAGAFYDRFLLMGC